MYAPTGGPNVKWGAGHKLAPTLATALIISWVVVLDGRLMGVFDDQWFLGFCVKFIQTAVLVEKNSVLS